MKISEIKEELELLGAKTDGISDKKQLEEALSTARHNQRVSLKRKSRILIEIDSIQKMKISAIKKELQETHNVHTTFFEKSEFVQALAEARVELADEMEKLSNQETEEASKKGANGGEHTNNSSMFHNLGGIATTIQNIQLITTLLQNAQHVMKDPNFAKILQKAQSNPKIMAALMDCLNNPSNIVKYQSDPEISQLLKDLSKCM